MTKFFHGTTSSKATSIIENGFNEMSYFTTSFEDASEYALMGGEQDLQDREETWESENGISPREHFGCDISDMYKELYPQDEQPIVFSVEIPDELLKESVKDSGADGAVCFSKIIDSEIIHGIHYPSFEYKVVAPYEHASSVSTGQTQSLTYISQLQKRPF